MLRRSDGDLLMMGFRFLGGFGRLVFFSYIFFLIPPRDIQDLESGLDLRVENVDVCLV